MYRFNALALLGILALGGCMTTQVYSLKVERIDSAYLDRDENLYVCIDGALDGAADEVSRKTVILPLSSPGLAQLRSDSLHHSIAANNHFRRSEIQGFIWTRRWLRQGCVSASDKAAMRPVPVVTDLVPKESPKLVPRRHLPDPEYRQARKEAAAAYLAQMLSGDGGATLYQLRETDGRFLPTLVYVTDTPRFNGTNKIGFRLVWSEEEFSPVVTVLAPVALVAAVAVGSTVVMGEKMHEAERRSAPPPNLP